MTTKLKKTQKNELYDIIKTNGMNPILFNCEDKLFSSMQEDSYTKISYIPEKEYYCNTHSNGNEYYTMTYVPGIDIIKEEKTVSSWFIVKMNFIYWITALKEEINAPDKWETVKEIREQFISDEAGNTPYTEEEIGELKLLVNRFKQEIKEKTSITPEDFARLESKIDHVMTKVNKLGRIDWKNLLIGTIINAITDPSTFMNIWAATGNLLIAGLKLLPQ